MAHLFFLVHGLFGHRGHMDTVRDQLVDTFGDQIIVYRARSNETTSTFDGISVGADRLFVELLAKIKALAQAGQMVTEISIVGYSLGGLFSRYLIGVLHESGFFKHVRPVVYATFASPHAGTTFHSKSYKAQALNYCGSRLLGASGWELFSGSPMLEEMAEPSSRYYQGLESFEQLFLFSNAVNDRTVPFWTSFLVKKNPFRKLQYLDVVYFDNESRLADKYKRKKSRPHVPPFLVNMTESKFRTEPRKLAPLTPEQQRTRLLFMGLIPVFLLPLVTVLAVTSMWSACKMHWSSAPVDYARALRELAKIVEAKGEGSDEALAEAIATSDEALKLVEEGRSNSDTAECEPTEDPKEAHAADATAEAVDILVNEGNVNAQRDKDIEVSGPAFPAADRGFSGLLDSVPDEYALKLSEPIERTVDNLNQLPWRKYAVLLEFLNSHGEIVDRRRANGQGTALAKFFALEVREFIRSRPRSSRQAKI